MAQFPEKANVVIIGLGGIVGSSVMHHLVESGWEDIVGIDKTSVPTDIGSTSHASDFCYATDHSKFVCYTTGYSIDFFDKMGHYSRIGGLEVARVGDDDRMMELKRKGSYTVGHVCCGHRKPHMRFDRLHVRSSSNSG